MPALPNWRSLLYVPATRESFVAKAHTRGADAIILDLEDAVAPAEKPAARAALAAAIPRSGRTAPRSASASTGRCGWRCRTSRRRSPPAPMCWC